MDSQSFDYWMSQGNYLPPPHQTTIFELPPDLSKVPSLSGSPASSTYDQFPAPIHQGYYPQIADDINFNPYPIPLTPSEFGSADESPYCSPQPPQSEPVYVQSAPAPAPAEKTHTTSGRRRAQNRAAQRAFRERKEKHARDLEAQLAALTDKYKTLETSHGELNAAYEKLRKTIELLTADDGEEESSKRSSNADTLRKLLDILHGEVRGIKAESN